MILILCFLHFLGLYLRKKDFLYTSMLIGPFLSRGIFLFLSRMKILLQEKRELQWNIFC